MIFLFLKNENAFHSTTKLNKEIVRQFIVVTYFIKFHYIIASMALKSFFDPNVPLRPDVPKLLL